MVNIGGVFSVCDECGDTPLKQHNKNRSCDKISPNRSKFAGICLFANFWKLLKRYDLASGDARQFAKRFKISASGDA